MQPRGLLSDRDLPRKQTMNNGSGFSDKVVKIRCGNVVILADFG